MTDVSSVDTDKEKSIHADASSPNGSLRRIHERQLVCLLVMVLCSRLQSKWFLLKLLQPYTATILNQIEESWTNSEAQLILGRA